MKKLLGLLGAFALTSGAAATVVACGASLLDKDDYVDYYNKLKKMSEEEMNIEFNELETKFVEMQYDYMPENEEEAAAFAEKMKEISEKWFSKLGKNPSEEEIFVAIEGYSVEFADLTSKEFANLNAKIWIWQYVNNLNFSKNLN